MEKPTKPTVKMTRLVTLACQRLFDHSETYCWKPTKLKLGKVLESVNDRTPDHETKP